LQKSEFVKNLRRIRSRQNTNVRRNPAAATIAARIACQRARSHEPLRDAFPAAVGFTDASWNPTEPAEVDATDASYIAGELTAVGTPLQGDDTIPEPKKGD